MKIFLQTNLEKNLVRRPVTSHGTQNIQLAVWGHVQLVCTLAHINLWQSLATKLVVTNDYNST